MPSSFRGYFTKHGSVSGAADALYGTCAKGVMDGWKASRIIGWCEVN